MSIRGGAVLPLRELLASVGVLTIAPVTATPRRRWSVLGFAPVVGLLLGAIAAGLLAAGRLLFPGSAGALLVSALAVGILALLTRGLHLDGLADTADGMGKLGTRAESLAVMRRADIGPFGVTTLLLVLLVDVCALGRDVVAGRGPVSIVVAVVCGRLALLQSGVPGIPAARPDGLGAWVAESIPRGAAWGVTGFGLLIALIPAALGHPAVAARAAGGIGAGCISASVVRRRAVRRFGGITGDVLGAASEIATCTSLLVSAVL